MPRRHTNSRRASSRSLGAVLATCSCDTAANQRNVRRAAGGRWTTSQSDRKSSSMGSVTVARLPPCAGARKTSSPKS